MTVKLEPLQGEDREMLHDLAKGLFLDGECYAFAIALHRALGWPIIGLMGQLGGAATIRHALVQQPFLKLLVDVRGRFTSFDEVGLGAPFGISPPYTLEPVTESDLYAIRPIGDASIARAEWMAQALYPQFPWRQGPAVRYHAYLEELDTLNKKHGVCMYAPFETAWPVLTAADGDEDIVFKPTINGPSYLFNRQLK